MGCGFSIVNISSAIFDCSAPDLDSCPDELLKVIEDQMTATNTAATQARVTPESSPNPSLEARGRENRKRRPDLNRPW